MSRAEPRGMAACVCARMGYALLLCQEHAPIPYELTERGQRTARRMTQWEAIWQTLEEHRGSTPRALAARKAWATRRAKAVK